MLISNYVALFVCLVVAPFCQIAAQTLPVIWEQKLNYTPNRFNLHTMDGSVYVVSTDKAITAFSGEGGKVSWSYTFEQKYGVKNFKWQEWKRAKGVILLGNPDDGSVKYFVDTKTGNELWRTDRPSEIKKYNFCESFNNCFIDSLNAFPVIDKNVIEMVNIYTGKPIWTNSSVLAIEEKGLRLDLRENRLRVEHGTDVYKQRVDYLDIYSGRVMDSSLTIKGSLKDFRRVYTKEFFDVNGRKAVIEFKYADENNSYSGTDREMTVRAIDSQDYQTLWQMDFKTRIVASVFGQPDFIQIIHQDNTLLLITEEITAFDVSTGSKLWSVSFVNTENNAWPKKEIYSNASSFSLEKDGLYIADSKNNCFRKIDLKSGKEIWKTLIKNAYELYPQMTSTAKGLLIQSGGRVPYESEMQSGGPMGGLSGFPISFGFTRVSYQKKRAFRGMNHGFYFVAPETGEIIWQSLGLSRMTDGLLLNGRIYAADKKKLFGWSIESGEKAEIADLSKSNIGDIFEVSPENGGDRLLVHAENGIALVNLSDRKIIYAVNTKKNKFSFMQGNNLFIVTDGNDEMQMEEIVRFDAATGALGAKYDIGYATYYPSIYMTPDGNFVFDSRNNKIKKLRIAP